MDTHYSKHHAAYTNNLNVALDKLPEFKNLSIEDILVKLPAISDDGLKNAVRNNEVDIITTIYTLPVLTWRHNKPEDDLASRMKDFGSFESLKEKLSSAAMGRFGSAGHGCQLTRVVSYRYPLA